MNTKDDSQKGSRSLKLLNKGFLFSGDPDKAYAKALELAQGHDDSPPGIKKAMLAAIRYNFAAHHGANDSSSVELHRKDYLKALRLLKKPVEHYEQLKNEVLYSETVTEESVRELFESEIAAIHATSTSLSARYRAEQVKKLIDQWENRRYAIFSEILVRIRKYSDYYERLLWVRCADALLAQPFFDHRIGYIDASYQAQKHSRDALGDGDILESHLFAVLKAAIDYNRALHEPGEEETDEIEIERTGQEYVTMRDTLLNNSVN